MHGSPYRSVLVYRLTVGIVCTDTLTHGIIGEYRQIMPRYEWYATVHTARTEWHATVRQTLDIYTLTDLNNNVATGLREEYLEKKLTLHNF